MPAMKTVPALVFLAALGASLLLPLSFEFAVSALFTTGFLCIALCDYSRPSRSLALPAVAMAVSARRTERFGLAA